MTELTDDERAELERLRAEKREGEMRRIAREEAERVVRELRPRQLPMPDAEAIPDEPDNTEDDDDAPLDRIGDAPEDAPPELPPRRAHPLHRRVIGHD